MANNLRKLRKEKGMTQGALAESVGATQRQIGAWERGENELPMDYASLIADILGCTMDDIAGRSGHISVELQMEDWTAADEHELLMLYRKLNEVDRAVLLRIARCFVGTEVDA